MALSRTPHGLLDMAAPALAAILWLGSVPPVHVIIIGLVTTFAGYTAVYAFNDVVDFKTDRRRFRSAGSNAPTGTSTQFMRANPWRRACSDLGRDCLDRRMGHGCPARGLAFESGLCGHIYPGMRCRSGLLPDAEA